MGAMIVARYTESDRDSFVTDIPLLVGLSPLIRLDSQIARKFS